MTLESSPVWFGAAIDRASAARNTLLEHLGAEERWLRFEDDGLSVTWCAGPAPTRFAIVPAEDHSLDLAVLQVVTFAAFADDIDKARFFAWDLNGYTTSNRWVIFADPGSDAWRAALDELDFGTWASRIFVKPESGLRPVLALEATFVFGDPQTEVPLSVIEVIVREQIAKVNALTTNEVWEGSDQLGIGEPIYGGNEAGEIRESDWNDVLFHYDNFATPHQAMSPEPILAALARAHRRSIDLHEQHGFPAWFGFAEASVVQWEVPYGPGPFDVVVTSSLGDGDPNQATSFIQAFPLTGAEANPHLGNGVILILRVGAMPGKWEDPSWNAALLNGFAHHYGPNGTGFSAHGLGAWLAHSSEVKWSMFIPSYWCNVIPPEDLDRFADVVLANTARLSWSTRMVFEELEEAGEPQPGGLSAGMSSRGPSFGETGSGLNPGAALLAATWHLLVGTDDKWAQRAPNIFTFQLSTRTTSFTTEPCACGDPGWGWKPGSIVTVSTPIAREPTRQQMAAILASHMLNGFGAVDRRGDVVSSTIRLHVHDDTLRWQERFPTTLAVAQALHVEQLERTIMDIRRPGLPDGVAARDERDEFMSVFDTFDVDTLRTFGSSATTTAIALGILYSGVDVIGLEVQGSELLITWLTDSSEQRLAFTSRASFGIHPLTRLSLTIRTHIVLPVDTDPLDWCLAMNAPDHDSRADIGGFATGTTGTEYVTTLPVQLANPSSPDGLAAFVGTMLMYNFDTVTSRCGRLGATLDPSLVAERLSRLVSQYHELLELPTTLSVTVHPEGGVKVLLPERFRTDPTAPDGLGARQPPISVLLPGLDSGSLRLLHALIVADSQPKVGREPSFFTGTHRIQLTPAEMGRAMAYCRELGLIDVDDEGTTTLVGVPEPDFIEFDYGVWTDHERWNHVLVLEAVIPSSFCTPTAGFRSQLGEWEMAEDHCAYRVVLPAAAFATTNRFRASELVALGITDIIDSVSVSWRRPAE